ncbi:MAG: glycosyl hydrolase [Saprospiraceae bacterium]|nr:glycosyl hydrolase [Saprospiraceae bacterium]MBP6566840.1 glycosyl hydrolase [Saprospiraceae bacterium]
MSPFYLSAQKTVSPPDSKLYSSLEWRHLGPFRGGRSCAVTGVPGKPNLFYFGATGGGVWKTTNGGRTWENISDGYFGGSIGSITVSPSDHNVIYVGGGEKTVRGNVSYGSGLWKSEDAGKTWTSCGLLHSRHITRVRVHPTNPDIVYAAVLGDLFKDSQERGVFKSIDGGKTWKKTLFANASAGAVDLCIDPTNHRILYAATWNVRRTPYSLSSGGDGSALWKSTDSGETWTNITANEGLPAGTWGIAGVAVAHNNNQIVYAIIENENGGVYRSDDGGKTWKKQNDDRSLRQRAWYYSRIYTDTKDDHTLYVLNVDYHKSVDGGKTFKGFEAPHGDHHDLWVAPENPDRMIIGDDGGAQVTYDGGETWSTYHNQPTSQFYRVVTDNYFPYRIYVAQQDNSTLRLAHRTTGNSISEEDWEETAGGESAHITVDPLNNDVVYGGSYDGFLTRVNHKTGSVRGINVWPDNPMGHGAEGMKYRFQWNFPIFFSRHNPKRLYAASNHLHMTEDEGQTWQLVSPDLTRNEKEKLVSSGGPITKDNTSVEYYATIFAVNESPVKEGVIWAGSDDGRIHVTQDGGKSWTDVTSASMPKYLMFNSVEPSRHDPAVCYVAGTMYKSGDYLPYLFKTSDYGKTWKKIVNGIPEDYFTRVVREDETVKGLLYAGTERGMFISYDDGESWTSFQMNLPIVPITDLALKNNNLIAATQGRSLWIIDDLTMIHQSMAKKTSADVVLFKPMDSYRIGGRQVKDSKTEGTNHPGGVMTHFYIPKLDEKKDTVSLTYLTMKGDTIRTYSSFAKEDRDKLKVKTSGNMFTWRMDYPVAKKFDGMILWWGSLNGPTAKTGDYKVVLNINGKTQEQPFKIVQSPVSEGSLSDIDKQFDFIKSVNDKVSEAHQAIIDIRSMKVQVKSYTDKISDKDIKLYAEKMDSIASEVEKNLYQTKNKSGQDPLNFPIRLTNKLAHLNSLMNMGINDFPPTVSMYQVRDELTGMIDSELKKWVEVKSIMLAELNKMIKQKALDVIILK